MARALIVYATRTNQTKNIADMIAEGLRGAGVEAGIMPLAEFDKQNPDLGEYDALVLGSPTYHGEMVPGMKNLLFKLEKAGLEGKVGGAFGAFGWSGEAPNRIFETMLNVYKMNMVSNPLRLKAPIAGAALQMADKYGKEIAEKLAD